MISKEYTKYGIMLSVENTFGEWLQGQLNERGMSQSQLAKLANLSRGTISNIINGNRGIGEDSLTSIARALRLPAEDVFRRAGILPPARDDDPIAKEAAHLISLLPDERKQQVLDYIRFIVQVEEAKRK